jgi:ParB/RepB/Spo0J family partition protein
LEHGVRYPLEVRPAGPDGVHHIISGERRWRAVGLAIEEGDLPEDQELLVVVKAVDDEAHLVLALEENIQRSRLTYTEEAGAYAYFVNTLGWDPGDVADKFGRGRKHVQDYLRLLTLPAEVLEKLDRREIRYREARAMFQDHRETPEPEPQLFDAEPLAPAPADPGPRLPELSAKEALVLAELVDKAESEPAEGLEPGWTGVAETPADKVSEALIRRQMLAFRSRGPESYARAMIHSSGVKAWLEVNGFYEGVVARAGLLQQLRADAKAEAVDGYSTPWLNPVPEAEDGPAAPAPKVQPGLVGDEFSEMMRRAREETDDRSGYIVPPPEAAAQAQAAEPAKPVHNLPQLDARVVSATMKDVNDQLALWRADESRPHWMQRAEAELEAELVTHLERGAVVHTIALLTVLRERSGAMGASHVMARALAAFADKSRES